MSESNELLRAARERTPSPNTPGAHLSRAELAEAVCAWLWATTDTRYELDGHYIAKLERGAVRWPGAAYRAGLREVLHVATDGELGFGQVGTSGPLAPEVTSCSMAGMEDELIDAGDQSVSLLALAEESNVGGLTVEQLHADIQRIAQNYLKVPTKALFQRSIAVRDRAFKLLGGRQPPQQTRDLYAAAGWALTLLGWMSVDLGRPEVAESHTRTAWACADASGYDELRAWVRATQHTAAFWQDDVDHAVDFALDGLRYAAGTSALFLASAAALDLARAGRTDEARAMLDQAKRTTPDPSVPELGGLFRCTPERAEGIWSDAYLTLGQPHLTLEHANRSVTLFESAPHALRNPGSERMARLQQVKAHLLQGELDGAREALTPVLATRTEYRMRPLIHRISEVAALTRTAPYTDDPKAQSLHATIREFTRHPATVRDPLDEESPKATV
jgi:tetratricopeptide (TPR) repeat protein